MWANGCQLPSLLVEESPGVTAIGDQIRGECVQWQISLGFDIVGTIWDNVGK